MGIYKGEREVKWRDTLVYKNRGEHNMTLYKLEESSIGRTQNDFFLLSRFVLLTFFTLCLSTYMTTISQIRQRCKLLVNSFFLAQKHKQEIDVDSDWFTCAYETQTKRNVFKKIEEIWNYSGGEKSRFKHEKRGNRRIYNSETKSETTPEPFP